MFHPDETSRHVTKVNALLTPLTTDSKVSTDTIIILQYHGSFVAHLLRFLRALMY